MVWFQFLAELTGAALLWRVQPANHWFLLTARLWSFLGVFGISDYLLRILSNLSFFGILAFGCVVIAFPGLLVSLIGAVFSTRFEMRRRDKGQAIGGMLFCLGSLGSIAWTWLQALVVG